MAWFVRTFVLLAAVTTAVETVLYIIVKKCTHYSLFLVENKELK